MSLYILKIHNFFQSQLSLRANLSCNVADREIIMIRCIMQCSLRLVDVHTIDDSHWYVSDYENVSSRFRRAAHNAIC